VREDREIVILKLKGTKAFKDIRSGGISWVSRGDIKKVGEIWKVRR